MKDEDVIKELLAKRLYLNAVEVAETSASGRISKLKAVLERMVWVIMRKKEDCYVMVNADSRGNIIEAEGSEDIKDACWVQIKKTLAKNSNEPALVETVIATILNCNPKHKIPGFLVELLDTVNLSYLYMQYGRVHDAALVLLKGLGRKDYIDPIVYAKVCETLKTLGEADAKRLLERLNDYH